MSLNHSFDEKRAESAELEKTPEESLGLKPVLSKSVKTVINVGGAEG